MLIQAKYATDADFKPPMDLVNQLKNPDPSGGAKRKRPSSLVGSSTQESVPINMDASGSGDTIFTNDEAEQGASQLVE